MGAGARTERAEARSAGASGVRAPAPTTRRMEDRSKRIVVSSTPNVVSSTTTPPQLQTEDDNITQLCGAPDVWRERSRFARAQSVPTVRSVIIHLQPDDPEDRWMKLTFPGNTLVEHL